MTTDASSSPTGRENAISRTKRYDVNSTDLNRFSSAWGDAWQMHGRAANDAMIASAFRALADHPLSAVLRALDEHNQVGKYPPKPVDVVRIVGSTSAVHRLCSWSGCAMYGVITRDGSTCCAWHSAFRHGGADMRGVNDFAEFCRWRETRLSRLMPRALDLYQQDPSDLWRLMGNSKQVTGTQLPPA